MNGYVIFGTTSPAVALDINGSVRPGSTGVTIGGACTAEGSFAYDLGSHSPVYCNQILVWAAMGVTVISQAGAGYVATCSLTIDGVAAAISGTYINSYEYANCPGIVPPGSTYSGGGQGYVKWVELR